MKKHLPIIIIAVLVVIVAGLGFYSHQKSKIKYNTSYVNIEWDVDLAEDLDSLPKEVQIPDGMTDTEEISDYLSNLTGFCHRGFGLKET